jgi:hypothetical protein
VKTILTILIAAVLCGCAEKPKPEQRWQYKELKVRDLKSTLEVIAWQQREAKKINQAEYEKKMSDAAFSAGSYVHPSSDLIELGSDGWELVSTFYEPAESGQLVMIFKRPYRPPTAK